MSARLTSLSQEALATLTSRGLARRAQRMLETEAPRVSADGDVLRATFSDGITVSLDDTRPLAEARCSCGAPATCRHVLCALLAAAREAPASPMAGNGSAVDPAILDDASLASLLGDAVLSRARSLRCRGVVAEVGSEGGVPVIRLPACTVSFLGARADLARCTCAASPRCEHVALAAWALREARGAGTVHLRDADAEAPHDDLETAARAALVALLLRGLAEAGERERVLLSALAAAADEARAAWIAELADRLQQLVLARRARSARYVARSAALALLGIDARLRAARGSGELPAPRLLGKEESPEVVLSQARLTGLGARIRADGERREADVLLAADDGTLLMLRKRWSSSDDGPAIARRAAAPGTTVGALARGILVSRTLKRTALREVLPGSSRRGEASLVPHDGDWSSLPPQVAAATVAGLRDAERGAPPSILQPPHLAREVRVLPVATVLDVGWDAAAQELVALLADPEDESFVLRRAHRGVAPGAIPSLARALAADRLRFVAGSMRWRAGELEIDPTAISTLDGVIVPDLEPPGERVPLRASRAPIRQDVHAQALHAVQDALADAADAGLQRARAENRERFEELATRCRALGLEDTAQAVRQAAACTPESWLEAALQAEIAAECWARGAAERPSPA